MQLSLGDSPKNVRELKSDIYELKNAIGDMVVAGKTGTTEYDQAVKLLGQDLQTLQQVQNSTKKEVDALDGSYNALVQRMRELKTEWRATNDVARRDELGKKITEINNQLKTLDYGIGNFQRNVGNYGNAWDSLAGTLNTAQSAGSQFTSGMQAMSGVLGLTTTQTESMNESLGVMRGVVGALNSAKGIAGLVKSLASQRAATKAAKAEADKEVATLKAQKVATDQVTVSTGAATVATKLLKAALMSIGIGAIVAAFGVLAANLDKVVGWFTKLGEKMGLVNSESRKLKKSNDLLNESIEAKNSTLEKEVELMQARGEDQSKILQQQKTTIAAELAEAKAVNAKVKARIDELEALGKRKGELKKLNEQYKKNEETITELEHKLAVLEAKIETDRRAQQEKAAEKAKKRKEKELKDKEDLAKKEKEILDKANSDLEAADTAREAEMRRHTKKLAELNANLSATTIESTKAVIRAAIEVENQLHQQNLTKIIVDEYTKQSEKAATQLSNTLKAQGIDTRITTLLRDVFSVGDFFIEERQSKKSLKAINQYYGDLMIESVKVLGKFKDTMTPKAKEALDVLGGHINGAYILEDVRDLYKKYLQDTEGFLKEYGEPFTTAIKEMGEGFEEFAESYTEGITATFDLYTQRLSELVDQGRLNEARTFFDKMWEEFGALAGNISPEAEQAIKESMLRLESVFSETLAEVWTGSTAALEALVKTSFRTVLDEIEVQISALKYQLENTTGDTAEILAKLAALEEDYRKLTMKRDAALLEARTRNLRMYGDSVSGLLGNVASAWENIIKAQVAAGKMEEQEAKESFERMKALQYAVAVISTASAVIQALADPTIPSYILKGINAAAALAAGIAQIAQISATHYGSSGSASTSMPSLVDRSPVTPTVSLNASEAGESMQQGMRVYVVESDITEAQDAARVRVSESTF